MEISARGKMPAAAWGAAASTPQTPASSAHLAARRLYRERRLRARHFPDSLFAEPAWDILLDLFIARSDDRSVSVSSACIAADVPPTTALRHIGGLVGAGWVLRSAHPTDARSSIVCLSDAAAAALDRYFVVLDPSDDR